MQFIIFARKLGYWLVIILSAKGEAEPQIVPTVFPRFFRAGTNVLIAQHTGCQGFEFDKLLTLKIAAQSFFSVVGHAPNTRRNLCRTFVFTKPSQFPHIIRAHWQ